LFVLVQLGAAVVGE